MEFCSRRVTLALTFDSFTRSDMSHGVYLFIYSFIYFLIYFTSTRTPHKTHDGSKMSDDKSLTRKLASLPNNIKSLFFLDSFLFIIYLFLILFYLLIHLFVCFFYLFFMFYFYVFIFFYFIFFFFEWVRRGNCFCRLISARKILFTKN